MTSFPHAPVSVVAWRLAWEDRLFRKAQFWTRRETW